MRVALVYDRLNKTGGAERVLESFRELYPLADWYTSVWDKEAAPFSRDWPVKSSFLSRVPWVRRRHEYFPFLMPFIFESFDFSDYDLVISIGSAECKGIITKPKTKHIHYCLTPTRYLYSHAQVYLTNKVFRYLARMLRAWDQVAATRPDIMISISTQVKKRIKQYYNRDSEIIFPPVDIKQIVSDRSNFTNFQTLQLSNYYLVVSRLVPYKKIDTLVEAFASLPNKHLVIAGTGSQLSRLKRLATPNVHFLGHVSDDHLPALYSGAEAYLQANEEDFGISMVEAQAAGTPVIAYGSGGAQDIVQDGLTGILLADNSAVSFAHAIDNFDNKSFDYEVCRRNAKRFDKAIWKKKMTERIEQYVYTQ